MTSQKDDAASPPKSLGKSPAPLPEDRRKLVHFIFPPGTGPKKIAKAVHELTQQHRKG